MVAASVNRTAAVANELRIVGSTVVSRLLRSDGKLPEHAVSGIATIPTVQGARTGGVPRVSTLGSVGTRARLADSSTCRPFLSCLAATVKRLARKPLGNGRKTVTLRIALCIALAVALAAMSVAETIAAPTTDAHFVVQAQQDALGQYALGVLGQKKGANAAVKSLATEIASNASNANFDLNQYAKLHGITPATKPTLRASYQYGQISSTSGSTFDKIFVSRIYEDVTLAVSTYHAYVMSAVDPTLKKFAQRQEQALANIATRARKLEH